MFIYLIFFVIIIVSFTDTRLLLHWTNELPLYSHVPGILVPYKITPLKYELTDIVPSKFMEIWLEGKVQLEIIFLMLIKIVITYCI